MCILGVDGGVYCECGGDFVDGGGILDFNLQVSLDWTECIEKDWIYCMEVLLLFPFWWMVQVEISHHGMGRGGSLCQCRSVKRLLISIERYSLLSYSE